MSRWVHAESVRRSRLRRRLPPPLLVTLVLGVAPQYFLDLANQAGVFVR